ncbi:PTS ascorbate transporter subunit IIB [Gilliamella sp. Choc5-1]|jgi:ascorbate PTS system EIIB component|uniref:PTS sugar transporter subunit IIB n=1 Tax=unclassified Gilliamella TaxID=2685620 RepID=UPI00080EC4A1|nr:PTS sugar transporter subunit IIB [Gilliamella apicola]OCG43784.1 PTS ascorbate transporter subunit IIB [Gilliamella apicola]
MSNLTILFVCGAGLGSSFAAQMATEDVLKAKGIEAKLDHTDISSAAAMNADIIITAENFRPQFAKFNISEQTSIVYLKNIVSKAEIDEKLSPVLQQKGLL